ncbi:MAG: 30S ribosomal protein S4e [Candidatus Aenigmatarchaeota archaeon]
MIIKRMASPKLWKIVRKAKARYAIVPRPGPHAKSACLPLGHILRDVLGIAENAREARSLLNNRAVKIDGRVRKDMGFPVGLMDVLAVGDKYWRVLPCKRGLELKPISEAESRIKLLKVVGKTNVRGKTQLNFHDGRNMLVDKDVYRTSDVVVYDLVDSTIKGHVQFKRGTLVLIADGINRGKMGRVEDIIVLRRSQPNRVVIRHDKETTETLKAFAFAIGQDKPLITL